MTMGAMSAVKLAYALLIADIRRTNVMAQKRQDQFQRIAVAEEAKKQRQLEAQKRKDQQEMERQLKVAERNAHTLKEQAQVYK